MTRGLVLAVVIAAVLAVPALAASPTPVRYSTLIAFASQGRVQDVLFLPKRHAVDATLTDHRQVESFYPSDQSQYGFQQLLERQRIPFDTRWSRSSRGFGSTGALLPILLLVVFWIFIMRFMRSRRAAPPS